MTSFPLRSATGVVAVWLSACSANANLHANAEGISSDGNVTASEPVSDTAPAPAQGDAGAAPALVATSTCPLVCSYAEGASFKTVASPEADALQAAFAPAFARFRECANRSGADRGAHGSPTLNLRFDAEGHVSDVGVDDRRIGGGATDSCVRAVPIARPELSMPGATTVRCTERCENLDRVSAPKKPTRSDRGRPRPSK